MDRTFPFAQAAREFEFVGGEDEAYQVAQQSPAIFLGGVDRLVPLLIGDEERVVLQQLLASLYRLGIIFTLSECFTGRYMNSPFRM